MPRDHLNPAELRSLEAMSHGVGRRGAAELLGWPEETVKDHLKLARAVLRAKNTTHACCEALRRGLIH